MRLRVAAQGGVGRDERRFVGGSVEEAVQTGGEAGGWRRGEGDGPRAQPAASALRLTGGTWFRQRVFRLLERQRGGFEMGLDQRYRALPQVDVEGGGLPR